MLWARIVNSIAIEIIDFDPNGRFHPDVAVQFVEVPDSTKKDAKLVDGQWINPTPQPFPTLEQIVQDQAQQQAAAEQAALVQLKADIVQSTHQRLDDFAKTRNYDSILSLCTYATSTVAKFKAEGQYGVEARDATWAKLLEILDEVDAGNRPAPSGYADIEGDLPVLQWPDAP